jgi:hypothetical protein
MANQHLLMTQEEISLAESSARKKHRKRWGPYLSEPAWGTVREDYSPNGKAWKYFQHERAVARLSLERRWPRWNLRPAAIHLLCAGLVE